MPAASSTASSALPCSSRPITGLAIRRREVGAFGEHLAEGVEILRDLVERLGVVRQLEKGAGIASGNAGRGG